MRRVEQQEVAQPALGVAADAVDAGHERQGVGARVVGAAGLGAHARVQPRGENVDDDLVRIGGHGFGDVGVMRRGIEAGDESGFHDRPPEIVRSAK
jgi:hypothetical protein